MNEEGRSEERKIKTQCIKGWVYQKEQERKKPIEREENNHYFFNIFSNCTHANTYICRR